MNAHHEPGSLGIFVVAFQRKFASFVIQAAFKEWHNQKTRDDAEHMKQRDSVTSPDFLHCLFANGTTS
jgi:hypothetical protein